MKFASIYLSNYIGIYNGMGLYDIHIDMTKCKNRITIIRGDNGSGKSTLSKAMSLFPDPNDAFIPSMPARKEIILIDGDVLYRLVFIHGIKQNGERDTTKAYITKTFNGQAVELNENGNVSSYKDILYTELGLDANFAALSQLSNDDRGLADKKPAERKRFVNSIISSLDTYNNIYKTLTKRSSNYKSMINAVVAKLNVLGDEKSLTDNLEALETKINTWQDRKDMAIAALAQKNSIVSLLDPDGSIQNQNMTITAELNLAEKEFEKIKTVINGLISSNNIDGSDLQKEYKSIVERKNSLIIQNQISRNNIESLMRQKELEAAELSQKIQRLSSLQNGYSYEELMDEIATYRAELDEIKKELDSKVGVKDITSINKEEYILALETLKDLSEYISSFKSATDFTIIESIVSDYIKNGRIPDRIDIRSNIDKYNSIDNQIDELMTESTMIKSKMSLLDKLSLRPSGCKFDNCEFIKDALEFSRANPRERFDQIDSIIYSLKAEQDSIDKLSKTQEIYNDAVNRFAMIVREIDKNGAILSKMPNGEMFKNKILFFERLMSGYSFEYMSQIYEYIDLANLFDEYKQTASIYNEFMAELKVYESKAEMIESISSDIDSINKVISEIANKIDPIQQEAYEKEIKIAKLQELEGVYEAIFSQLEKQKPFAEKITECRSKLLENSRKMNEIRAALSDANTAKEEINQCAYNMEPLMKERDKVLHSVQMMKDYTKERDELQANYDFIETIKYYSSPTTGIQLVFMELYMGKIIALANELLGLLFNGQFVIQQFVINETEFRIPCLGSGYLNDDISSMSSSQIGMISMILSFALLHHSSTKYNIIKLDEIDGPLDYNNRLFFMDVLNSIMDIMQTEQCIMISHNSELQVDNSDVILLKHDENNMDYQRGNVIWSY